MKYTYKYFDKMKSLPLKDKIVWSEQVILRAIKNSKIHSVSLSWGKDSIVMLYLIRRFCTGSKVIFANTGCEYPETYKYRNKMLKEELTDMEYFETKPIKKQYSSIRLNHNTFKFFPESKTVSISTINGRQKYAVKIPPYFQKYDFRDSSSARIRTKKGRIFLDIIAAINAPNKLAVKKIVGVDRGVYYPAVTSDNTFFNSKKLREVKRAIQVFEELPSASRHSLRQKTLV